MKQLLLSLTMLLFMGNAFGQTPTKLIEKYKAMPGAMYENTTKESLEGLEKEDSILSAEDIAKLKKHFKKSEQVQIQNASEELLAQINKDIKALKNHELLFETVRNAGSESLGDSANMIKQMIADFLNPTIKLQCYGKVEGKMVSDLLIRVDIWNTVALSHLDTKIDRDIWMKALERSNLAVNDNEKAEKAEGKEAVEAVGKLVDGIGNIVDMKDILEDVKNGDALIVINGKEYPELHSTKEAAEYMKKHNIWFNNESWIVGEAVKEKYPHTDKKVVIEYSEKDEDQL
ncbi:MAG: hypothetical protein IKX24_05065 [Prevotella sp.]|nr:hypothetical protein [Prevotella sp.]